MKRSSCLLFASLAMTASLSACAGQPTHVTLTPENLASAARSLHTFERPSLGFESNLGQVDRDVYFLLRSRRSVVLLTSNGMLLALSGPASDSSDKKARGRAVVGIRLMNANPSPAVSGIGRLPRRTHHFAGADSAKWRTNIPNYASVAYRSVYRDIDLLLYGNQQQLEYDFVLAPGANPHDIVLGIEGADSVRLDSGGNLVVRTAVGELVQRAPVCYQEIGGVRRPVAGRCVFRLKTSHRAPRISAPTRIDVAFEVSGYDASRPLVVDPVVAFSTYLGGSGSDGVNGTTADAAGNVYVTGETSSINFPITPGVIQPGIGGASDVFVTKLSPAGAVLYSTYIGGSFADRGTGIATDTAGNAYVTGRTASTNFPTTPGAFRQFFGGDTYDAFVAKLNPDGSTLLYSTFLGGSGNDSAFGIAVDAAGSAWTVGGTASTDFPVTGDAFQPSYGGGIPGNDGFVTKLNGAGSNLQYSTYLGGSFIDRANSITLDSEGNGYVTGWTVSTDFPTVNPLQPQKAGNRDAFVTKFRPDGGVAFSTFLGGTADDAGLAVAVDASGSSYVTGFTDSTDFPTPNAYQPTAGGGRDAFLSKLEAAGSALVYSTYLGGSGDENLALAGELVGGIAVDSSGRAHVTGSTRSGNFPLVNPTQPTHGGVDDAFVTRFNAAGDALEFSTFLGGSQSDIGTGIAVHSSGDALIAGQTSSTDFPTANASQPTSGGGADAFVARIADGATATADLGVTQMVSPDPVMPGADITYVIDVTNGGPDAATSATLTDVVPTGTTFQSLSSPVDWSCSTPAVGDTGTVACTNASVAAGGSAHSFTVIVRADSGLSDGTVISNTAVVGATTPDPIGANNSATVTTTVASGDSPADLTVAVTDAPDPASASSNITYTITVGNSGPGAAISVSVLDEVPADTTFSEVSASLDWSCTTPAVGDIGPVNCTIASLASGATEVLTLTVRVDDSVAPDTLINNTVSVSSSTSDPDDTNNGASATTSISAPGPHAALTSELVQKVMQPSHK